MPIVPSSPSGASAADAGGTPTPRSTPAAPAARSSGGGGGEPAPKKAPPPGGGSDAGKPVPKAAKGPVTGETGAKALRTPPPATPAKKPPAAKLDEEETPKPKAKEGPAETGAEEEEEGEESEENADDEEGEEKPKKGKGPKYELESKTFKVKGQDYLIPDVFLPMIKSKEIEEGVRDILQKAGGFQYVYQDREHLQKKINEDYVPMEQTVQTLLHFRDSGDLASFFEGSGVPLQAVLTWALNYAKQTPEQRTADATTRANAFRALQMQMAQGQQTQGLMQQVVQGQERELSFILSRPEISSLVSQFDTRFQRIGAFRDEVITRGQFLAAQGRVASVEEVVNDVLRLAGLTAQAQPAPVPAIGAPAAQPTPTGQPAPAAKPVAAQRKPVIPSVQAGGASPAKRTIRTRDDWKTRRRELEAQGR